MDHKKVISDFIENCDIIKCKFTVKQSNRRSPKSYLVLIMKKIVILLDLTSCLRSDSTSLTQSNLMVFSFTFILRSNKELICLAILGHLGQKGQRSSFGSTLAFGSMGLWFKSWQERKYFLYRF